MKAVATVAAAATAGRKVTQLATQVTLLPIVSLNACVTPDDAIRPSLTSSPMTIEPELPATASSVSDVIEGVNVFPVPVVPKWKAAKPTPNSLAAVVAVVEAEATAVLVACAETLTVSTKETVSWPDTSMTMIPALQEPAKVAVRVRLPPVPMLLQIHISPEVFVRVAATPATC